MKDFQKIMEDNTYKEFIPTIFKIYDEINKNEIDLVYNIPNDKKEIKIFGKIFVENNKDLCKIIYENKEYALSEKFNCENIKDNLLKIKLTGINNSDNLSSMFESCSELSNLSNLSKMDTTYMIQMGKLFKNCKFFELPDISNWNINNVMDMEGMFSGCSSLISLPDISKWNTRNVYIMKYMFKQCSSLKSLPEISKWDIINVLKYKNLFCGIKGIFDGCSETLIIPGKFKNDN